MRFGGVRVADGLSDVPGRLVSTTTSCGPLSVTVLIYTSPTRPGLPPARLMNTTSTRHHLPRQSDDCTLSMPGPDVQQSCEGVQVRKLYMWTKPKLLSSNRPLSNAAIFAFSQAPSFLNWKFGEW